MVSMHSVIEFASQFHVINLLPMHAQYASIMPYTSAQLHAYMHSSGQSTFQHDPYMYWLRLSIFLNLPSRYNLAVDSEVYPCRYDYNNMYVSFLYIYSFICKYIFI